MKQGTSGPPSLRKTSKAYKEAGNQRRECQMKTNGGKCNKMQNGERVNSSENSIKKA